MSKRKIVRNIIRAENKRQGVKLSRPLSSEIDRRQVKKYEYIGKR